MCWRSIACPAEAGDTTEVKFPTTAQRRRGLGPVKHGNTYGVLVHAMIAVDATTNACLGLVGGEVWTRPGVVTERHRDRPFEDRESHRWLATAERAREVLRPAAMITVVSDREGDIYPKWAALPPTGVHLLTRAMMDRRLVDGGTLFAAAGNYAVAGKRQINLPARQLASQTVPNEPLSLNCDMARWRSAVRAMNKTALAKTVRLWLIDVREVNPPADIEPLHWRLVTTHEITDTAKAWQVVGWYQAGWVIEQLFRVKKSQGLQLEDSQIATGDRLVKLAAAATKAACIDMQLVQERDGKDQLPASNVFSEPETETLEALCPTLEGNTKRQQNLHPLASLAWAAWIISRLGGWNCYYKPAGPITMRRGMEQFYSIHGSRQLEMMLKREVRIP
jgi:hypothetical protein